MTRTDHILRALVQHGPQTVAGLAALLPNVKVRDGLRCLRRVETKSGAPVSRRIYIAGWVVLDKVQGAGLYGAVYAAGQGEDAERPASGRSIQASGEFVHRRRKPALRPEERRRISKIARSVFDLGRLL